MTAIALFFALCALGVVGSLALPQPRIPAMLATVGAAASLALLVGAALALFAGQGFEVAGWGVPPQGTLSLRLDRLGGVFLFVAALVALAASIYSAAYLHRYLRHYSLRSFGVWYFVLLAAIALVLLAGDVLAFLLAWEAMSIASYLLVNFEHERDDSTQAGYLMLAMGEAGTLAAAFALLLLAANAGSLDFDAIRSAASALDGPTRWAVFGLSLAGFGVKAGLLPVNAWLPRAHPAAPANVSALLSGVILNLGLYGIVRVNLDLAPATSIGPGLVTLAVGSVTAFIGILYATTDNDLKRLLAHSSIENIGIVVVALGAGMVFVPAGRGSLAAIAFVAALYHMTNHSVYKALLFLGAGSVDLRAGTRELDRLGGLIHRMPWTAACFLAGALAISAVYPLNGFASEWLTLQSLLRSVELEGTAVKIVFALAGVALALTAALAVTCFVKAFAMAFLGMSRSQRARRAEEAPPAMRWPMAGLAVLCLVLGMASTAVIGTLDDAVRPLAGGSAVEALVPPFFAADPAHAELPAPFAAEFHDLGAELGESVLPGRGMVVMHRGGERNLVVFAMSSFYGAIVLGLLLAIVFALVRGLTRVRQLRRGPAWDGGVRRLFPEMTYTATGFSNPVRVVFDAVLRPRTVEDTEETVAAHFRIAIRRSREERHIVDRWLFEIIAPRVLAAVRVLARMHHGHLNAYVGYVLLTLLVLLTLGMA
jgi:hydrogenase-4 component B